MAVVLEYSVIMYLFALLVCFVVVYSDSRTLIHGTGRW
jgi:hypothetical protein